MKGAVAASRVFHQVSRASASPAIAILIPCYNEEAAIANVVHQFQLYMPDAHIYVFDNNSSDQTATRATEAGAIVIHEPRQGKGSRKGAGDWSYL